MLRVYYGDVRQLQACPEGLFLSEYRLKKLAHLKPELSRKQGIGAELLLIHALRAFYGEIELPLEILSGAWGKPYLAGAMPQMNLSHSGSFAACAISDRAVGLDIQMQSPCREDVLRRFFCQEEQDFVLRAPNPDAAYSEIWCKKESVLKANGHGLSVPLSSFSIFSPGVCARIWHTQVEELHLSVCVTEGDPTPELLIKSELP